MKNRATEELHELWDALADYPASQADAALTHLMKTLCGWLGADNAFWVGAVRMASGRAARRDAQHGWRLRVTRHLHPTPASDRRIRHGIREQETEPPMTTCALTAGAGAFRVHRLRDGFVDFAAFSRTAHYRMFYEAPGIADRMAVLVPVNADAESWLMFDHVRSRRRFSAADAALAADTLRGLKWFHRQVLLSHGLPLAREPLSPAERRVLLSLLGGQSEKAIAADLGLTLGTTHQYAVDVYRKLGINSRSVLTAIWLG